MRLINRKKNSIDILSKSELFESFIDQSSTGCIIFDESMTSLQMNTTALRMLNLSPGQKVGSLLADIMPNMSNSGRTELFQGVIKSGKPLQFRDYLVSADGNDLKFEVSAFKVGKGIGFIICDTNVCDFDATQLRNDNAAMEAIQGIVHDPILILDSQNRVLSANYSFYKHFAYKSQSVLEASIFSLGEAQWNIAELHELLEFKLSQTGEVRNHEVSAYFGALGPRTLLLNASKYYLEAGSHLLTFVAIRDITELANQREKLQKLSTIYANAPDPILITDLEGKIINVNDEAVKLYGWSRTDLVGKSFKTLIPTTSRDQYENLLQAVIVASRVDDVEVEHWSKNGSVLPINMNVQLLENREGEKIGTVTYVKHIASQSQAEKALKRIYDMLLYSNDPVVVVDMNGIIIDINDAAETAYLWSKASVLGKPGTIMVEPMDHGSYQASVSACFTGKVIRNQAIKKLTKQGVVREALVSMYLLTNAKNNSTGAAIVVKHATDTDRANRVHKKMINQFIQIQDPVVIENMAGEVIDINQAAITAYGWAKNDVIGKLAQSVIPVDQQKQASDLIQRCKAGETLLSIESKRWTKAGRFFPVQLTMFQISDPEEVPIGIVTISRLASNLGGANVQSGPINMEQLFREHVDPIVIEDLTGNIIEINDAASKMLGWKPQDLKGKPIKMIIPADQHKHHEKILLLSQNNVPIQKVESKRWSKTGEVFPVAVSLVLLKDDGGQATSIASITWDITDVKNMRSNEKNLKMQLGQH